MTTTDADGRGRPAMDDEAGLPAARPPSGGTAFEGPAAFADALRAALREAADRGTRRLCWCDPDFSTWPLGEADWIATLVRWARPGGRELVMVASSYDAVERLHPRFVAWRRDWSHVVHGLLPDESRTTDLPTLWIDSDDRALRVIDREHLRGRSGFDRLDRQRAREEFDAISQRASPGFSATTLGL